jgi:hypothetical protein
MLIQLILLHGAVDVSGDLDVPRGLTRAHGGRRNPGVEFDSALLDSSSSLTLFGPSTSPTPFSRRFSPFHSPAPI